jgi:hypothetical protein
MNFNDLHRSAYFVWRSDPKSSPIHVTAAACLRAASSLNGNPQGDAAELAATRARRAPPLGGTEGADRTQVLRSSDSTFDMPAGLQHRCRPASGHRRQLESASHANGKSLPIPSARKALSAVQALATDRDMGFIGFFYLRLAAPTSLARDVCERSRFIVIMRLSNTKRFDSSTIITCRDLLDHASMKLRPIGRGPA